MANKYILLALIFLCCACDDKQFFDQYISLNGNWTQKDKIAFSFEQKDTINLYNMFVTLRNNNEYPFNNLFLIVKLNQPNQIIKIDTLEYAMAYPDGTLMGNGITDTKHSKLWYKENFKFSKAGKYKVYIEQANRETGTIKGVTTLKGVTEVGFRIEKK